MFMPKLTLDLIDELQAKYKLQKLASPEAVRRQGQAYALNLAGKLIALSLSSSDLEQLSLGEECAELKHLYLAYNEKLAELDATALPELEHLYLNNCALHSLQLPSELGKLKQLYVQNNHLQELRLEGGYGELELLDAGRNGMKVLSMPSGFRKLKYVYLRGNNLDVLPDSFAGMPDLEILLLAGNPLSNIPAEVVGSGDTHNSAQDVRAYLGSIQGKQTRYLHEAKMILIGNPMVGKSSIRIKLKDPQAPLPTAAERTPGLDVEPYLLRDLPPQLTRLTEPIDFQLNIWDFGGQGRYREIQQFFCSRKSLYLYVTAYDDQPGQEDYVGLDYWMSMVNAYGYDEEAAAPSPVIYVLNKINTKDEGIDEKSNRERYANLIQFAKISCAEYRGFEQLLQAVREALPLVSRDVFDNRYNLQWFRVKERLAGLDRHYLSYGEYLGISHEEGLEAGEAKTWLSVLDRIGSVIYTGNFEEAEEWIILNPHWVKDAICKVLDSKLMQRDGLLKEAYFDSIWSDYPDPTDRANLVQLMLNDKYRLAYVLPSPTGEMDYMVPSALFNNPKPNLSQYPHLEKAPNYRFQFRFEPFIPAGMLNKLLVTLHPHIYNTLLWGNGGVLHDGQSNTFVILQENWQERCIRAEFFGETPQAFFDTLRDTLQKISTEIKDAKFLQHLSFDIWLEDAGEYEEVRKLVKYGRFPWPSTLADPDLPHVEKPKKKKIFFSYSKKDKEYLEQLSSHLAPLRNTGKVEHWDDGQLRPGEEWDAAIKKELAEADIILLLISADFLNTNYIWEVEINAAMARHERGEAIVIPVFIRSCDWQDLPFGKLSGLPSKAKPISSFPDRDAAWFEVVKGIRSLL
jgi:internalin A